MSDAPIKLTALDSGVLSQVDQVVEQAVAIGEPELIFTFAMSLRRALTARGYALAKLLYMAKEAWEVFSVEGEFEDVIYERIGLARQTVVKYCRLWKNLFVNPEIPQDVKDAIMGRNIRDAILLSAGASDGTLDPETLLTAATMPDSEGLRDVVRKARGEITSSSTAIRLTIVSRRDHGTHRRGTLLAQQDGKTFSIGWLDLDSADVVTVAAVHRIINSTGMSEV